MYEMHGREINDDSDNDIGDNENINNIYDGCDLDTLF
jgi:hypothetical protein